MDSLRDKRGFYWLGKWWQAGVKGGHEETARNIIKEQSIKNPESWVWNEYEYSAQDYMVLFKGAIQVGCALDAKVIIAAGKTYSERDIEKFKKRHNLHGYRFLPQWR